MKRGSVRSNRDATEPRDDHWSTSGYHIYRHHVAPRDLLYAPQESSFPFPLKYMGRRAADKNIPGQHGGEKHRRLLERGVNGRFTKNQVKSRPDTICPKSWTFMSRCARVKAKQQWGEKKLRLQAARQSRGIRASLLTATTSMTTFRTPERRLRSDKIQLCLCHKRTATTANRDVQTQLQCLNIWRSDPQHTKEEKVKKCLNH